MSSIFTAFRDFWDSLLQFFPDWLTDCLVCVSVLCIGYAMIRWILQLFKARKWLKLCDLLFCVIAIGSIAYYVLPNLVQPLDIMHNIDFTGVIPVLEVTGQ